MNPDSILSMLQPLREPAPVAWWPPAPGWWLLALLLLALLAYAFHRYRRFRARGAPLREARQALADLTDSTLDARERAGALAELLRRTAIAFRGRRACAGLTASAWADFLNALAPAAEPTFDAALMQLSYHPDPDRADVDRLEQATQRWLASLETPR